LAIVSDSVEEYHGIAVRFCWTRKPALKMAAISCSYRNVPQSRAEPGGSGFGRLALSNTYSLGRETNPTKVYWRLLGRAKDSTLFPSA
jgi:hypothetical protein